MYILNEVCYLTTSIGAIYFLYNSVIALKFHGSTSCDPYVKKTVYLTTLVATIHITSGLCLIRENLNDVFI